MEYIPVQVHIIESESGNKVPYSEIYESFKDLNAIYNGHNLNFYFCSNFNYIKSEELYNLDTPEEAATLVAGRSQNVINVYYVGNIKFIKACGYATLGHSNAGYIVIQSGCTVGGTLNMR